MIYSVVPKNLNKVLSLESGGPYFDENDPVNRRSKLCKCHDLPSFVGCPIKTYLQRHLATQRDLQLH